jgi:hypothetical protein
MAQYDIRGTVTDEQGNVIPNARVYLFRMDNPQSVVSTTADGNGEYVFTDHPDSTGNPQEWFVAAEYTDGGGTQYNVLGQPYVQSSVKRPIPDSGMFQSPLYQYTAVEGLSASDGQTASNWTEQLAGAGDATAVGDPLYRTDQGGFEAVEYDGFDDGHDYPSDGNLPTGGDSASFAATIYVKSASSLQNVVGYGTINSGDGVFLFLDGSKVRVNASGGTTNAQGGSLSTGQWITVGGVFATNDAEAYLNGSSVATDTAASFSPSDSDRSIAYRAADNNLYADIYVYDLVICDARESDQAFSDYDTNRLG